MVDQVYDSLTKKECLFNEINLYHVIFHLSSDTYKYHFLYNKMFIYIQRDQRDDDNKTVLKK